MRKLLFSVFIFLTLNPVWAQPARNDYVLYLTDAPVSERFQRRDLLATREATTYRQQIEGRQQDLRRELARRNIRVTGSVSTVLNAVFVTAPASRLAELQTLPGVAGVRPVLRGKKHLNTATQLMDAPTAWSKLGGPQNAGAGIKIAILDSGIDQTHPAFQDSSLAIPAGFPICTNNHPEDCAYTNNKVIVARSYVRNLAAGSGPSDSAPDDYSPRDRNGHGTAVAAAAAANQNSATVTFTGMAPKAYLGNYKIEGSPGVNDFILPSVWIQAIEDALNDGMDIANLSSGSPAVTGALDTGAACGLPAGIACDPVAAAFENAAKMGLIITVAAGNSGADGFLLYPNLNSIASPASAPSVITAGATLNSHVLQPSVTVTGTGVPASLVSIPAQLSDSYSYGFSGSLGALQAPLVDITQLGDNGFACSALPANSLNNVYALVESNNSSANSFTPCDWMTQSTNIASAGGIGAVFYQGSAAPPINPENIYLFGPVVMVSNSAGVALKSFIDANPGRTVIIDAAGTEQNLSIYSSNYNFSPPLLPNQVASYSSFGPTPDGAVKPDLVATGGFDALMIPDTTDFYLPAPSGLYTAAQHYDPLGEVYSTNGYAAGNGTSFAAPVVAGAAALAKQTHPGYTAAQIKSLLVNSVSGAALTDDGNPVTFGAPTRADVERSGAGLLDAGSAANATVTSEPSTISFGVLKAGSLPITKALTITNHGSGSVTLSATVSQLNPSGGTSVTATGPGTLAAGAAGTLSVMLSGSIPTPGEYSGFIIVQGGGGSLRIPYMYLVGDGVPANVQVYGGGIGTPGEDDGPMLVRVVDQYGVPVAGSPVNFNVSPVRGLTLESVSGAPGCTPASSSSAVVCNTDSYGIAWAEVILGSSTTVTPSVSFSAAGFTCSAAFGECPSYEIIPAPVITAAGVVDPVAYSAPIAPGSYISIFGSNLVDPNAVSGSPTGDSAVALPSGALPLTLDGVTVSFDVPSAGISVPGYMYYVGPPTSAYPQINLWVPRELQGQSSVQVKVTVDEGIPGNVVTVPLTDYAPVFFSNGGILSARDSTPNENVITPSNPATRGQAVLLFANGLGPVTNTPASGDPASGVNLSHTQTDPVVMIGNQTAQFLFSGLAPGFAGLYQVNVIVPTNISAGTQPVTLSIGGKTTPVGMLYVQ